jgi:hypothetical protein
MLRAEQQAVHNGRLYMAIVVRMDSKYASSAELADHERTRSELALVFAGARKRVYVDLCRFSTTVR